MALAKRSNKEQARASRTAQRRRAGCAHWTSSLCRRPIPVRVGGRTEFTGYSKAKSRIDVRITKLREKHMPSWTLHDLHRTCATGMARIGVAPHVIEAVLNHISGSRAGVAGLYNTYAYEPEKRAALGLWAGHIEKLIHPDAEQHGAA